MISDKLKEQLGDWECLYPFFESQDWTNLKNAIKPDEGRITPDIDVLFRAFRECPYKDVRVVWLGLSPYYSKDGSYKNELVADGLAFSTAQKHDVPQSLFKIYKGMEADLWGGMNLKMDRYNELSFLAKQGILLINSALTTVIGKADSHIDAWRPFVKFVIKVLNENKNNIIFTGFGRVANDNLSSVDTTKHIVLEREHPAASAYQARDWNHKNLFSETNKILKDNKSKPILWDSSLIEIDMEAVVPF